MIAYVLKGYGTQKKILQNIHVFLSRKSSIVENFKRQWEVEIHDRLRPEGIRHIEEDTSKYSCISKQGVKLRVSRDRGRWRTMIAYVLKGYGTQKKILQNIHVFLSRESSLVENFKRQWEVEIHDRLRPEGIRHIEEDTSKYPCISKQGQGVKSCCEIQEIVGGGDP